MSLDPMDQGGDGLGGGDISGLTSYIIRRRGRNPLPFMGERWGMPHMWGERGGWGGWRGCANFTCAKCAQNAHVKNGGFWGFRTFGGKWPRMSLIRRRYGDVAQI